ncbi:unnamed protein product [Peronospora destructor]|uniref:Fragile site-associated protein C-terminal domain-containing protein n=1 Tax=Peronospora destructor TaxID=86335 RepID=A0AAV0TXG4_9STRA|nr:unnamed protein product [Peronospora destructor]
MKKRAEETALTPTLSNADAVASVRVTTSVDAVQSPPLPAVSVAMLSKTEQSRVDYRGGKGELLGLGEIYLNELSDIYVFEVTNQKTHKLKLQLRVELRMPFQNSQWRFQLENENVNIMQRELQQEKDRAVATDEFNHVPFSVLRSSSKAALCAENVYLCEGYNELFNHIGTVNEIELTPRESKRVVLSMYTTLTPQHNAVGNTAYAAAGDSSEEERAHLSETSCFVLSGRLILQPSYVDGSGTSRLPIPEMLMPLQGQVCRSLLRLDVKELHFDDCVPGGSFVKDFTVWNRSEIPLLFKLVSPMTPWSENKELLVCTDYNSGYVIGDKTLQAAAYGHVRIRVTFRPTEIGERFFDIQAQNLHDSRNVKTLKIHAITNQEHHREGLSIKEPSGSYLMSGSRLNFGDCYTGIASSKVILMRNMTEVALYVDLTSDRPKEITFEMKLQQNRSRVPRAPRVDELLSPTNLDDGASSKGSFLPDGSKTPLSFPDADAYGPDSDEEVDDNEADFFEEDFQQMKRNSFEENPMGDAEDLDDDFEFDRELRVLPQSTLDSQKVRCSRGDADQRKKALRTRGKESKKTASRAKDVAYDGCSPRSSPERSIPRDRHLVSVDDNNASNFLVETIDLPPGVERTILIWYSPASSSNLEGIYDENADAVDLKAARLTKQTFRVSFRCFLMQGAWQQTQSRVYDRTLGKSIHIRARTCTSIVTVTPSILHLGDCNIGELKSSSCILTNHSELPTVVKPLVMSKVISTVPNDDMMLGPKQSTELKIEIIPRKTNPNYSRLVSIANMKNKSNVPQICVRSSNMDAHHVIYHSLFYKLLTQSRSAFLNFEQVTINSVGVQVFDLENITNAPLHLNIGSSAPSKLRLYCMKHPFADVANPVKSLNNGGERDEESKVRVSPAASSLQNSGSGTPSNVSTQMNQPPVGRTVRRRRSFCSVSELTDGKTNLKRGKPTALRELLTKKLTALSVSQTSSQASAFTTGTSSIARSASTQHFENDKGRQKQHHISGLQSRGHLPQGTAGERKPLEGVFNASLLTPADVVADRSFSEEVTTLLQLFAKSRADCDAYCHSSLPLKEKEEEIVAMVRERTKRLQAFLADKRLTLLSSNKEKNVRVSAKSRLRIVAVLSPVAPDTAANKDVAKIRVERHKIMITLPPGGNKKAVTEGSKLDQSKLIWAASKHPFDTRSSVRELLLKSRVCRSVMNVNQKNINFGRISTSSKSSKRLIVQNMSPTPLVYSVEKTGSISSGFLQIKEGEVGVVKAFGTKEICFQFQPTLAGPFEEKLKIINVQDVENLVSVTIKAKVVKRETFKLLQSGQTISLGKCIVGEKTEEMKIAVRNTSRKKRDARKKLDEELEKLEHKLRIAVTKKKADKIIKLNAKISQVKALLSGEQILNALGSPIDSDAETTGRSGGSGEVGEFDPYDSANSESELSESESSLRSWRRSLRQPDKSVMDVKTGLLSSTSSSTNMLRFSLGAEATGRVVAYAIFNPLKCGDSSPKAGENGDKHGVGKFILFEQQNKDVVKELQYNAEIFLRTPAGKNAYCRAVGRKPPSVLPPHPKTGTGPFVVDEGSLESRAGKPRGISGGSVSRYDDVLPSLTAPVETNSAAVERRHNLTIQIPDLGKVTQRLNVVITPNQLGKSPSSSSLLIPAEESPSENGGWSMTVSLGSLSNKVLAVMEVVWNPVGTFKNVLAFTCDVVPPDFLVQDDTNTRTDEVETRGRMLLPLKLNIPVDRTVTLNVKWCFTSDAGFALSTPLASCVSRSVLESASEAAELNAGTIDFFYHSINSVPPKHIKDLTPRTPISSVDVAIVKAVQRSLCFEIDALDLGEHQQGDEIRGKIVIHNRSHQALQYLLLAGSRDQTGGSISSSVSPLLVGGDMTFENATGTVQAGSFVTAAFVYKGSVPGHHNEQIVLRNLSGDRLDTSVLTLSVRIVRPVYVRIPELDPQVTGQLEILDLGPCYVTPEMQDIAVDSPNVSFRFSKVHKLTLHSQVEDSLIICASSNLKTQCYVYEDARLQREATHVVMNGMQSIDLYVAIRPRLSLDAIKTGSTRDLVGGIRVQLFGLLANGDTSRGEKSEMLAEFTVKFIGVAGASIARVTPSLVDFGVEYNSGHMQTCQTHEGQFELINMMAHWVVKLQGSDTNDYQRLEEKVVLLVMAKGDVPNSSDVKHNALLAQIRFDRGCAKACMPPMEGVTQPQKSTSERILCNCTIAVDTIEGGKLVPTSGYDWNQSFDARRARDLPTCRDCIHLRNARSASRIHFNKAEKQPDHAKHFTHWSAWKLRPGATCVLDMEQVRTEEITLLFLSAYLIYAKLVVDPESSDYGAEPAESNERHAAFLPPITVPTPHEAPHRANFWFSLRNVYDDELSVKLSSQTHSPFDRTIELLIMLRSANTSLTSIVIAPGESVDIRVVCHVLPSARLSADMWSAGGSSATSENLDLGRVWLDISIHNKEDTAQRKEVHVKGKLLPGKTFLLSASSLHFFATATDLLANIPVDQLPPSLKLTPGVSRDSSQITSPRKSQQTTICVVHQLLNSFESFCVRNPSTSEVLNFVIDSVSMYQPGLCLIEGSAKAEMCAISEWVQAIAVPSSGTIAPNESVKITVHLEEAAPRNMDPFRDGNDINVSGKMATLHKMRHNPIWRSNSWDADSLESLPDETGQNHMFLTVRDADSDLDTEVLREIDVLLVQQQQSSSGDNGKQGGVLLDKALITAAFNARNNRLAQSRKLCSRPALETDLEDKQFDQSESSGLDNFEKFDISSISEYSSLANTRYLIDVGQHTIRNGGEVESHSYQSVVLHFLRGVVGVYMTFLVLQNLANPSDLKVIHVRLEVIADLNSLRGMSSELDPMTNLFRVLVSNHGNLKRPRRSSIEMSPESTPSGAQRLTIDFNKVYYYKLYQNHSIVIENSSGLSLDFILSTNARPQEVGFSVTPMSFNEVTTVTLGAHARMQVFLHFRPQPKQMTLLGASDVADSETDDPWVREIEVYVSCRLVKDFRETVVLRAICSQPQLMVKVVNGETNKTPSQSETYFSAQPTFLGLVFSDAGIYPFNSGFMEAPSTWDHSVKEHVTLYNIRQFAEHYQVTLCFTYSNVASFYVPPNITESCPISALEDIVAKFLQNYECTWKWLISYHEKSLTSQIFPKHSPSQLPPSPAPKLVEILDELESASEECSSSTQSRDNLYQLVQSYRALYFDFYYITDELVWHGVRGNAVRHSLALADLAYGVVFNHEVFQSFVADAQSGSDPADVIPLPRLLLPWIRQLRHFLSFFPENQEATQPLRQVYDRLRKFEAS